MKPVGRERDIEIAKLKESLFYLKVDIFKNRQVRCEKPPFPGAIPYTNMGIVPYWSTDRNAAWELEKEIINDGYVLIITYEKIPISRYIVLLTISNPHNTKTVVHMLQTVNEDLNKAIADCVSQAWIIWKESKK